MFGVVFGDFGFEVVKRTLDRFLNALLTEKFVEISGERILGKICDKSSIERKGDRAGFLADDDSDGISFLGDTEGGAMAKTATDVGIGDGEIATGSENCFALDDDGAVVQRSIWDKNLRKKAQSDGGIDWFGTSDDVGKVGISFDDD